LVLIHPKPC